VTNASRPGIQQLGSDDAALMEGLLAMFGEAFEDIETYRGKRPGAGYLRRLPPAVPRQGP